VHIHIAVHFLSTHLLGFPWLYVIPSKHVLSHLAPEHVAPERRTCQCIRALSGFALGMHWARYIVALGALLGIITGAREDLHAVLPSGQVVLLDSHT
jgi:hypothetical protein